MTEAIRPFIKMKQQPLSGASTEINISNNEEKPMSSPGEPAHPWRSPGYHESETQSEASGAIMASAETPIKSRSKERRQGSTLDEISRGNRETRAEVSEESAKDGLTAASDGRQAEQPGGRHGRLLTGSNRAEQP
ncbi:hypothetical protein Nepgr_023916 [Nepenthes gracilis]|uniref:Uncharacterized protein n=1 Tax=Nepenthes gracilis TaxID=150966 RepID=A0AAD3T314_NEPGR|nr:hypothetical protein Nepgr_023916 [Nepenthes gracilis]